MKRLPQKWTIACPRLCSFLFLTAAILFSPSVAVNADVDCPVVSTMSGEVGVPEDWARTCNPAAGQPPEGGICWPSVDASGVGGQAWGTACHGDARVMAYDTSLEGCRQQGVSGTYPVKLDNVHGWSGDWWMISNPVQLYDLVAEGLFRLYD